MSNGGHAVCVHLEMQTHMKMLDASLHEQRLHLIFKQTTIFHRRDKEGKSRPLKRVKKTLTHVAMMRCHLLHPLILAAI
ncbi:hypothetical protein CRENBAI_015222 [Crenichthys baileyi]|uniref:Uncharacterized protein n=1 Tax=Crenichthys baileyi TaxID=28760 RepID=A0AAV9RJR4_9TELE